VADTLAEGVLDVFMEARGECAAEKLAAWLGENPVEILPSAESFPDAAAEARSDAAVETLPDGAAETLSFAAAEALSDAIEEFLSEFLVNAVAESL